MSNISSNALFHFTPKAEYLIGILSDNFIPRYCYEETNLNLDLERGKKMGAIPMVCFCDIPLSQINNHVKTYGNYGIGLTKEWAIKNKLNPLIYINENSVLANHFAHIVTKLHTLLTDNCSDLSCEITDIYLSITDYLKPYSGNFLRNGKIIKNVKFYNEREWRFIPNNYKYDGAIKVLGREDFDNETKLAAENNKLKKHSLKFNPEDIKYIFVKDESEIHSMIEALRQIKGKRFDKKTLDILASKILTTKQIEEDF